MDSLSGILCVLPTLFTGLPLPHTMCITDTRYQTPDIIYKTTNTIYKTVYTVYQTTGTIYQTTDTIY